MNNNRKMLIVLLCCLSMVATGIFGTLAYLTDTDVAVNTFSFGSVSLTLDEAAVNLDGTFKSDVNQRVKENKYHLLPGHTYIKDPTIHMGADSAESYLFVKVENGIADIEGGTTIAQQMAQLGWTKVEGVKDVYILMADSEKRIVTAGEKIDVFENFTIDGDKVVNDETASPENNIANYKDAEIIVTAYAVQKAGFEDTEPKEIWDTAFAA